MTIERVLMVDDDPVIVKFVSANLRARGFEVVTAEDGEAALRAMEQTTPNLVLLDLLMPGIDGFEVCRRIRRNSAVPIIVLTAIGESSTRLELLSLGANDYITKPFDVADLLRRVRSMLCAGSQGRASDEPCEAG
ncbi:MAG: response regulator [Chloroflexi bacterium]|nr:response regulator [Chloroflexota bacterium]